MRGDEPDYRAIGDHVEDTSMETPSHFSKLVPNLALVWDSTALSELMFCPERYRRTMLQGWRGSSVDLEFGGFIASALEHYKKSRIAFHPLTKKQATNEAVKLVLKETWREGQPWGGHFEEQWHCTGTEKYKNAKGNRAKCPYAHKGVWFPEPAPSLCGECGSRVETQTNFLSEHYAKNRISAVRAVIWWCDEQPQELSEGLHPYRFLDGTLAVELFVAAPLPFKTQDGETYVLSGHLDELAEWGDIDNGGELFVLDNKTTAKSLASDDFFSSYSPNVQFDTYDVLAKAVYPDLPIDGIYLSAIQVMKDAVRTGTMAFYKTEEQREEHLKMIGHWLGEAEKHARSGYYPMNKRNCGFCQFRKICSLPPEDRDEALEGSSMTKQTPWNPLTPK